jgi:hypothetical protein
MIHIPHSLRAYIENAHVMYHSEACTSYQTRTMKLAYMEKSHMPALLLFFFLGAVRIHTLQ